MLIFVFSMKAQVTRKRINLYKLFFMNYIRASVGNSLQFITSIDLFGIERCKITFGAITL